MILVATGLKREARIVAGPGVVAVSGGARADALEARLMAQASHADAILSFGLAGALAPDLAPGDLFVATSVTDGERVSPTDEAWLAALLAKLPGAQAGVLFGSDAMLLTREAKAAARTRTGAIAVDMESQVATRAAARAGLPFAVVRAISDAADRDLPGAVSVGMTPEGDMNLLPVLAALARRPGELLGLVRAGREAERAFRALADARHLLGPRLGRPDLGQLALDVG
jgi:adenosylhomocysteine nucleosidase